MRKFSAGVFCLKKAPCEFPAFTEVSCMWKFFLIPICFVSHLLLQFSPSGNSFWPWIQQMKISCQKGWLYMAVRVTIWRNWVMSALMSESGQWGEMGLAERNHSTKFYSSGLIIAQNWSFPVIWEGEGENRKWRVLSWSNTAAKQGINGPVAAVK